MNEKIFFDQLIVEFPKIKTYIESEDPDLVHLKMEIFADYTIEQIQKENISELKKCFAFQENRIDLMNSVLKNALIVSFCESMLLGKCSNKMEEVKMYMPNKLKLEYLEYEKYYNNLRK